MAFRGGPVQLLLRILLGCRDFGHGASTSLVETPDPGPDSLGCRVESLGLEYKVYALDLTNPTPQTLAEGWAVWRIEGSCLWHSGSKAVVCGVCSGKVADPKP